MRFFIKLYWFLNSQLGIYPRTALRSLSGLIPFLHDYVKFRRQYRGKIRLMPCLNDRHQEGGVTKSEYFWQDLLIAQMIYQENPVKHVDIGSRIDGFVAHVASFREIEVFDVRPINQLIPGVTFKQADLMEALAGKENYCDSISCLHALEHFGLGRYGDPVNPDGFRQGITNLSGILQNGGKFYLSVPIGTERVEFNAHRVFNPHTIINLAQQNDLILQELAIITSNNYQKIAMTQSELDSLATREYALGIFIFKKKTTL
jgi:hypothetical protein